MKEQGLAYCAAMNSALVDLDRICQESERLKNRPHQLDEAIEALKPMIVFGDRTIVEASRPVAEPIEEASKPMLEDQLTPQMVGTALPKIVPMYLIESADPIQRRIDSDLGLAVA